MTKQSIEYATVSVRRFRSPDGQPTCCADHPAGETCRYLGSRCMGAVDVCMLGEQRDLAPRTRGYQRPDARCEVWAGQSGQAWHGVVAHAVAELSGECDDETAQAQAAALSALVWIKL